MARLRASWRTSLPVAQQPRNPQSESIARSPYECGIVRRSGAAASDVLLSGTHRKSSGDGRMAERPQRLDDGTFAIGNTPIGHRAPGVPNKINRDLRNGVIDAAVRYGRDGKGKGGLKGYFDFLSHEHPTLFAGFVGRLLPRHLDVDAAVTEVGPVFVSILPVASNTYVSADGACLLSQEEAEAERRGESFPARLA